MMMALAILAELFVHTSKSLSTELACRFFFKVNAIKQEKDF